jgi:DNA-binding response OmpR family regulator
MKVSVVGQDEKFCRRLREILEAQHHHVHLIADVAGAFDAITAETTHLVVISGLPSTEAAKDLIRALRGHGPTRHVAILSIDPRRKPEAVVETLDAGADDFLAKPFNEAIFLARVRTLLRRQIWTGVIKEEPVTVHTVGPLSVHLIERVVRAEGQEVKMTRLEFDLLAFMVKNKGEVLSRGRLLEAVWKYPENVETRTLDKHVENLRKKLGKAAGQTIRTIHGVGYRLMEVAPATPKAEK